MDENILVLRDVCKTFPGVKALDHVDFDVKKGEVLALAGENGAGKSTLMKILSGSYTRDCGTIEFCGKPAGDSQSQRRRAPRTVDHLSGAECSPGSERRRKHFHWTSAQKEKRPG